MCRFSGKIHFFFGNNICQSQADVNCKHLSSALLRKSEKINWSKRLEKKIKVKKDQSDNVF